MAAPEYGDFDAVVGSSVQRLGYGYPEPTVNDFHGLIQATPVTGVRNRGQEQTINRGLFQRPGKAGKWSDVISLSYHLDVHRAVKLFAAMIGNVVKAVLSAGVAWRYTLTPSASRADTRWHTMHFNRNGRVYTHYDSEPLSWAMNNGDEFWDCQMEVGCVELAHCQAFPTTTVNNTYTGLAYAFGQYFDDAADTTYEIEINVTGITGVAEVRTRKSGDVGWADNQVVYEGQKIYVRDENEVDSGMFVVFKRGGPSFLIVSRAAGAGDTATITVNGTPTVLTEGVDFVAVAAASDAAAGQNLADAINANAILSPNVVAYYKLYPGSVDRVVVIPKDSADTVTLATGDATAWSVAVTTATGNTWTAGGGPDAWTLNSRGIVVASSVPDHTVFSPNSFEVVDLLWDGTFFELEPNSAKFAFARGLLRTEYRIGSPFVKGYPRTTFDSITGGFKARSATARYLQDSNSNTTRSFMMRLVGQLIGASAFRERWSIEVPQLRVDPGIMEGISQEYVNYHEVSWKGHGSTDEANDAVEIIIDTDEPDLVV